MGGYVSVNNVDIISKLLDFTDDSKFYHLQILQRRKENPTITRNSKLIKSYYIDNMEYLMGKMDDIIQLCDKFNARAMINLNRKSYSNVAFKTLQNISAVMMNGDFNKVKNQYNKACGQTRSERNKTWIVDIDKVDEGNEGFAKHVREVKQEIYNIDPHDEVICEIPSKNGVHLITKPFRVDYFKDAFPKIDIQKNNPTNLYIP